MSTASIYSLADGTHAKAESAAWARFASAASVSDFCSGWLAILCGQLDRVNGAMVSDRDGVATPYALFHLQERGTIFIPANTPVYEGMVVGEYSRDSDLDVNVCREKKLTNMRASGSDATITLIPPRLLSLEQALEFISTDECVEVTPKSVRLRKVVLDAGERARLTKARKSRG